MYEMPIVKIELQGMRQTIMHAFTQYQMEISESVNQQLIQAVDNFPYKEMVYKIANEVLEKVIKDEIESYFRYGDGRKIIKERIAEMLENGSVLGDDRLPKTA